MFIYKLDHSQATMPKDLKSHLREINPSFNKIKKFDLKDLEIFCGTRMSLNASERDALTFALNDCIKKRDYKGIINALLQNGMGLLYVRDLLCQFELKYTEYEKMLLPLLDQVDVSYLRLVLKKEAIFYLKSEYLDGYLKSLLRYCVKDEQYGCKFRIGCNRVVFFPWDMFNKHKSLYNISYMLNIGIQKKIIKAMEGGNCLEIIYVGKKQDRNDGIDEWLEQQKQLKK